MASNGTELLPITFATLSLYLAVIMIRLAMHAPDVERKHKLQPRLPISSQAIEKQVSIPKSRLSHAMNTTRVFVCFSL